jgi:hypothetical protein
LTADASIEIYGFFFAELFFALGLVFGAAAALAGAFLSADPFAPLAASRVGAA